MLQFYIILNWGCSLPQPTLSRGVQGNDTSPLGIGQVANIALTDQCIITFNADQRLFYDTITVCKKDHCIGKRIIRQKCTRRMWENISAKLDTGTRKKYEA